MVAFYKFGGKLVLIKVAVMVPELEIALDKSCRTGMEGRDDKEGQVSLLYESHQRKPG